MTTAYLTPADVAERLACSTDSVLRAVKRGALPALVYGRLIRIKPDDLDRFIDSNTRK